MGTLLTPSLSNVIVTIVTGMKVVNIFGRLIHHSMDRERLFSSGTIAAETSEIDINIGIMPASLYFISKANVAGTYKN